MSPFGGNSSSATTNEQPVATDQGRAVSGKSNTLVTDQGINLANNKGQIGGTTISGNKGAVTITSNDPNALLGVLDALAQQEQATLGTVSDLSTAAIRSASDTNASALAANKDQLGTLISTLDTLAQNQQSGGTATPNKTVETVVIVGLGVLALYFWRKN